MYSQCVHVCVSATIFLLAFVYITGIQNTHCTLHFITLLIVCCSWLWESSPYISNAPSVPTKHITVYTTLEPVIDSTLYYNSHAVWANIFPPLITTKWQLLNTDTIALLFILLFPHTHSRGHDPRTGNIWRHFISLLCSGELFSQADFYSWKFCHILYYMYIVFLSTFMYNVHIVCWDSIVTVCLWI